MSAYDTPGNHKNVPERGWDWEPTRCPKFADVEYGRELQCNLEEDHAGECKDGIETDKTIEPLWEAMDCPDVTDDPFYDDFDKDTR